MQLNSQLSSTWRRHWISLFSAAGLLALIAAAVAVTVSHGPRLLAVLEQEAQIWQHRYPYGVAAAGVLLVAVWIVCLIPSTPIELTLGYLYGLTGGLFCVYTGKVLGCLVSFFLGRTVLYDLCQRRLFRHELLRAIDMAMLDEPYRISFLARGAYIPIALKNYGFAVLSVPWGAYVAALVTVELWNSASLVFLGHAAESIGDLLHGDMPRSVAAARVGVVGLACALLLALSAYGSIATRRALVKLRKDREDDSSTLTSARTPSNH